MRLLTSRLMVFLAAVSMASFAMADSDHEQMTGRACKQFIATGVISQTWASLLSSQANISSPLTTPIKDIAAITIDLNTSIGVRNAVEHLQTFIRQCPRHCSGLTGRDSQGNPAPFNCERIGDANSNQLLAFSSSNQHMADDAVSNLTEEQLAAIFGEVTNEAPNVVVDEPVAEEQAAQPQPSAQPNYRNYWTPKVGQGEEELIVL